MKIISIGLIAIFTLLVSEVQGNEPDLLAVKNIHAGAYFGRGEPFEIDPWNKVEKWSLGKFDPSQIWMTAYITLQTAGIIGIKIFLKVQAGSIDKSIYDSPANLELIKKTAAWGPSRLIKNDSITLSRGVLQKYLFKFSLDDEIDRQYKRNKWPYILDFRFEFVEPATNKILVKTKTIYLIPKYGEVY